MQFRSGVLLSVLVVSTVVLGSCATNINITDAAGPPLGTDSPGADGTDGSGLDNASGGPQVDLPTPEPDTSDGGDGDSDGSTDEVAPTPTPFPKRDLDLPEAIEVYFESIEAFWTEQSPILFDQEFEPVTKKVPYRPREVDTIPECGGELGDLDIYFGNAFYCPPDDFIAWDNQGLFPDLFQEFGDFTVGLVLAHEYGHAMQNRTRDRAPTIYLELQADCYAGAWAGAIDASDFPLSGEDLNGALGGFLLFRDPLGTDESDPGAHGSAFDRVSAFAEGFRTGAAPCATYLDDRPEVATIFLDSSDVNQGNLPLDDLIPLLTADLEPYLQRKGDELVGAGFTAPSLANAFGGAAGDPSGCGEISINAEDVRGVAFLCASTGQVYYDRSEMDQLFGTEGGGDFAPAYSLAHAYAESVVSALGIEEPNQLVLASDCLVGLWAREIWEEQFVAIDDRVHELSLSAGDLDEGIFGLILVPATVPSLTAQVEIRAFDRVEAFGDGFFEGQVTCGF